MFYSNEDYTVMSEEIDGEERYFLTYHSATGDLPKTEITRYMFGQYRYRFRWPYRKREKNDAEIGAHLHVEDYLNASKLDGGFLSLVSDAEEAGINRVTLTEIDNLVSQCSETQQRRFRLCVYDGLSYRDAARVEGCNIRAVWESVSRVLKKIENFYQDTLNG